MSTAKPGTSLALPTLAANLATRLGAGSDGQDLVETLKATAFKGPATDAQISALLIVAQQYGLNPWTREIYAFPDRSGIVPVVGVDGWSRIINEHPQFDGLDFDQNAESCTCTIHRKDRAHPTRVTEYLSECRRDTAPWKSHPRRMMRHKALIQCSRYAFGYTGIFDRDEAEAIEAESITAEFSRLPPEQTESLKKIRAVTEARAALSAQFARLGWDSTTRREWAAEHYPGADSTDLGVLSQMVDALAALAEAQPEPDPQPETHQVDPDADVPF
jgi:phage recombination protein Bet